MKNLKLTRVDFRLIHGQVMTRWVAEYQIKSIICVDDKTAKSPILKKILLGAAPGGIKVEVETLENAVKRWKEDTMPTDNLMILFKTPESALQAYQNGMNYPSLQIGGIEGARDKKQVARNITMSKSDIETLKVLDNSGVKVYCQAIPDDPKVSFNSILTKL